MLPSARVHENYQVLCRPIRSSIRGLCSELRDPFQNWLQEYLLYTSWKLKWSIHFCSSPGTYFSQSRHSIADLFYRCLNKRKKSIWIWSKPSVVWIPPWSIQTKLGVILISHHPSTLEGSGTIAKSSKTVNYLQVILNYRTTVKHYLEEFLG